MACFSINVVNQINVDSSLVKATRNEFKSTKIMCGFKSMMLLRKNLRPSKGYLLNDTLDLYFTRLGQLIVEAETSTGKAGCSHPAVVKISKTPKKKRLRRPSRH